MSEASFAFKFFASFFVVYNTMTFNDYIRHIKRYDIHKLDDIRGQTAEIKRITKELERLNNKIGELK